MRIRCRLRSAVEPVGVADPIGPIDVDTAPLVGVLVFIHMLIRNAQNVQAQAGGPGTTRTGSGVQHKIAIGVVVMLGGHGIAHLGVKHFPQGRGDPGKLFGPTGGYIIGYILLALISGFFVDRFGKRIPLYLFGMILGTAACYLLGTLWLAFQLDKTFLQALSLGVIPYIPGDIVKLILATAVGFQIRKRLLKAGLLSGNE